MTKFAAIVGTNNPKSTNKKLLEYLQSQFFYIADIEILEIDDLPVFDVHSDYKMPDSVAKIKKVIDESDGVIIAAAEYDHMPTAALLNAISWLSYKIHPLSGRPVLITGASYGNLGTSRSQGALRTILVSPEVDAQVFYKTYQLGNSLQAFDDWGDLRSSEKTQEMEEIFQEFLRFAEMINKSREENLINIHNFDNFKWDKIDKDTWEVE